MNPGSVTATRPVRHNSSAVATVLSAYRTTVDRAPARGWAEVSIACGREPQRSGGRRCPRRFYHSGSGGHRRPDVDVG